MIMMTENEKTKKRKIRACVSLLLLSFAYLGRESIIYVKGLP